MTLLADMTRGDTRDITLDNLKDKDGNPTIFGIEDVVTFTMKRHHNQADAAALMQLTSLTGGVEIVVGEDHAFIHITSEDWDNFPHRDVQYVWDVQIARGATDPPTVVTVASGDGVVQADATLTVTVP